LWVLTVDCRISAFRLLGYHLVTAWLLLIYFFVTFDLLLKNCTSHPGYTAKLLLINFFITCTVIASPRTETSWLMLGYWLFNNLLLFMSIYSFPFCLLYDYLLVIRVTTLKHSYVLSTAPFTG
jgi:hypothetical protein